MLKVEAGFFTLKSDQAYRNHFNLP